MNAATVSVVWMVGVLLVSFSRRQRRGLSSVMPIAKTWTPDSVSGRTRVVRREAPGRLDSKLFPATAGASCFYKPKPPKPNSGKRASKW